VRKVNAMQGKARLDMERKGKERSRYRSGYGKGRQGNASNGKVRYGMERKGMEWQVKEIKG
jgi:hypothetical protein